MWSNIFGFLFEGGPGAVVTWTFFVVMGITIVTFLIRDSRSPVLPNILTVLGVLGTFVGITIALTDFDPNDIEGSIPTLLEGLKTAFVTSIAGISLSLITKAVQHHVYVRGKGAAKPVSLDTLIGETTRVGDAVEALGRSTAEGNATIARALSGDEDGSLLTQLKNLRIEVRDAATTQAKAVADLREQSRVQHEAMVAEFREFSRQVAENNARAFMEALAEVIRDFNTKLTEQFGENFKELNAAVGRLLEWQDAYAETIKVTYERIEQAVEATEKNREALEAMGARFETISEASEGLADILRGLETSRDALQKNAERFSHAVAGFEEGLPRLEQNVIALTEEFSSQVARSIERSEESSRKVAEEMQTTAEHLGSTSDVVRRELSQASEEVQHTQKALQSDLSEASRVHGESVSEIAGTLRDEIRETMEAFQSNAREATEKTTAEIRQSVEDLQVQQLELRQALEDASSSHRESVDSAARHLRETVENSLREMQASVQKTGETLDVVGRRSLEAAEKGINELAEQVILEHDRLGKETAEAMRGQTKALIDNYVTEIDRINRDSLRILSEGIERVDEELGEALKTSLETLGQQLTALSEKFVADYGPLTDRLREVVRIAENGDGRNT